MDIGGLLSSSKDAANDFLLTLQVSENVVSKEMKDITETTKYAEEPHIETSANYLNIEDPYVENTITDSKIKDFDSNENVLKSTELSKTESKNQNSYLNENACKEYKSGIQDEILSKDAMVECTNMLEDKLLNHENEAESTGQNSAIIKSTDTAENVTHFNSNENVLKSTELIELAFQGEHFDLEQKELENNQSGINDKILNRDTELEATLTSETFNEIEGTESEDENEPHVKRLRTEEVDEPELSEEIDFSYELEYFQNENLIKLASFSWESDTDKQKYTKGCLWSPDGTCCLVGVNGDGMHLMELPTDLYEQNTLYSHREPTDLKSAVHVPEAGMVYDYAWYPFMNSGVPESCFWISTRQCEPIHMWDAFNGSLRASYLGYDEVDEVQAAIAVVFSNDGEHIIGGYKKSIKVFDTTLPGKTCLSIKSKQAASAFALSPINADLITAGTWNGIINMYDKRMPKAGCMSSLFGHKAGVTFMKFNYDATVLYSGSRKENSLFLWDMRNFSEPLMKLTRNVQTNQRIYFDLSPGNNWVASGDTDGLLRVWDACSNFENELKFPLHKDCCNGVSFHTTRPVVATTSGQYHFLELNEEETEESKETFPSYENKLNFWWIGKCENDSAAE